MIWHFSWQQQETFLFYNLLSNGHQEICPTGVQRLRHEVAHSLPLSDKVDYWSYTSRPPVHLHGRHRNIFTLYVVMTNTVILIQLLQWSSSHIFSTAPLKNFKGCLHIIYWFVCLLLNKHNSVQSMLTLNNSLYCLPLHVSALSISSEIQLLY